MKIRPLLDLAIQALSQRRIFPSPGRRPLLWLAAIAVALLLAYLAPFDTARAAPPPDPTSVSPNAGPIGGGTNVTISGSQFNGTTSVTFGGTAATNVVVVSNSSITATTPAHAAGLVNVVVTDPADGSGTLVNGFNYAAAPTVTNVNPNSGPSAGGATVTLTGTNFVNVTAVTFGGTGGTSVTVQSVTQLTVVTPAHARGAVDVVVTAAGGAGTSSNGFTFADPPTIASVNPAGSPPAGGVVVVITGTNFNAPAVTAVAFGGDAATSFTIDSNTQITATAPAHALGAVNLTATNPDGAATLVNGFTYADPPTISTVSPNRGWGGGGTSVTITGTNFTGVSSVTFGGVAGTNLVVGSSTQLTVTTPPGDWVVAVTVTAAGGAATLNAGFTFLAPARAGVVCGLTQGQAQALGFNYISSDNATINGTGGSDYILGGNSANIINGLAGNDFICGGNQDDTLNGGDGEDILQGENGQDTLNGGNGDDFLHGDSPTVGNGADTLNGGPGNDLLEGGNAQDTINGDDGNDTFRGGNGNDTLNGGNGTDCIDFSPAGVPAIVVNLATGVATGDGTDTLISIECVLGSAFADTLTGGPNDDTLDGGPGNDTLGGAAGNDGLVGGLGNDTLSGGDGNDSLAGNEGNDTLSGEGGNDSINGGDGADTLFGGDGNDALDGGEGDDTLFGGDGDDILTDCEGSGDVDPGAGADIFGACEGEEEEEEEEDEEAAEETPPEDLPGTEEQPTGEEPTSIEGLPDVELGEGVIDSLFDFTQDTGIDLVGADIDLSEATVESTSADGAVSLSIPLDSLSDDVDGIRIHVSPVTDIGALQEQAPPPPQIELDVGDAFEITIEDLSGNPIPDFSQSLTLTITVDPEEVNLEGATLFFFDPELGEWVQQNADIDPSGAISFQTDHLSLWAVFEVRSHTVWLHEGWNLVTYTGFSGRTVQSLVEERIGPSLLSVWRWNVVTQDWDGFVVGGASFTNRLGALNQRDVLFVRIAAGHTARWEMRGLIPAPSGTHALSLFQGLTTISYTGPDGVRVTDLLAALPEQVGIAWRFDQIEGRWVPYVPGAPQLLNPFDTVHRFDVFFILNPQERPLSLIWPES